MLPWTFNSHLWWLQFHPWPRVGHWRKLTFPLFCCFLFLRVVRSASTMAFADRKHLCAWTNSEARFGTLMHAALLGSLATCRCPQSTQKLSGTESHWGYQLACSPTPSYFQPWGSWLHVLSAGPFPGLFLATYQCCIDSWVPFAALEERRLCFSWTRVDELLLVSQCFVVFWHTGNCESWYN